MESVEEFILHNPVIESDKVQDSSNRPCEESEASLETDVCHKSNGVAETIVTVESELDAVACEVAEECDVAEECEKSLEKTNNVKSSSSEVDIPNVLPCSNTGEATDNKDITSQEHVNDSIAILNDSQLLVGDSESNNLESVSEPTSQLHAEDISEEQVEETVIEHEDMNLCNERVTFETEILVETNDNEDHVLSADNDSKNDSTNNILTELGQNIELSEALRSENGSESVENNNCAVKQEVFNKEELLDILEGKDVQHSDTAVAEILQTVHSNTKSLETQLALQQLSRLKSSSRRKSRSIEKFPRKRKFDKKVLRLKSIELNVEDKNEKKKIREKSTDLNAEEKKDKRNLRKKSTELNTEEKQEKKILRKKSTELNTEEKQEKKILRKKSTELNTEENIVKTLVKDWEDDDATEEMNKSNLSSDDVDNLLKSSGEVVQAQEIIVQHEEGGARSSIDSTISDSLCSTANKSGDESQPQRRLGRVIKKKVIFDPDNPDTFTKGKSTSKNRETFEKDTQPLLKKTKVEQLSPRSKSKSPTSKLQWKKPPPKNSKQNRRLTEVDKLLMDEGAVNMIYQLTPEAPKGKKNMKTKAEFIKKIQSSTPVTKEMKFRERKKETKGEEGEAKKILGGKQRSSLSSSVKSPSVCEDFEAHSADDSIIYRRHSSSSYSSSCMSPRRLSDVDIVSNQSSSRMSRQTSDIQNQNTNEPGQGSSATDVFMPDITSTSTNEMINKDDCLSIKEKLNSKLSLALNKRKRDNSKVDKLIKVKKIKCNDLDEGDNMEDFKNLSLSFNDRLAEIFIRKTGCKYTIETMSELVKALAYIESRNDISVTLLLSECGTVCAGLDLKPLLNDNMEKKTNYAHELAESVRLMLSAVWQHSKLLCVGVEGRCRGLALALLSQADVALGGERASFALAPAPAAPLVPGLAALSALHASSTQALVNDLAIFGRRLSASEALQGGLVSRILWSDRFSEQARALAMDIAAQPSENILLKKQLLNLKKTGAENTFLASLEKERDLFVEYWTSVEGQELLRASLNAG